MAGINLRNFTLESIINRIDHYMAPYIERSNLLSVRYRPTFGEIARLDAEATQQIIEVLIEKKLLKIIHLQVLLDASTTKLPCDENSFDTPFTHNVLSFVAGRCLNFQEIHFHGDVKVNTPTRHYHFTDLLEGSLLSLSRSVTVIDFTDAELESCTLRIICLCFKSLKVLNLHSSRIRVDAFENLVHRDSVIKSTIESLTVDRTPIQFSNTANCLIQFEKMKYFKADWTIASIVYFQAMKKKLPDFFKTTVLKQNFYTFDWKYPDLELIDRVRKVVILFPFVTHAIFTSIQKNAVRFINKALTLKIMTITKLELSCFSIRVRWDFLELEPAFGNERVRNNLTSLTLECFDLVDVFYLGVTCKKLEELVLINNTYKTDKRDSLEPLINLEKLEVLFLSQAKRTPGNVENFQMKKEQICFLMSSQLLEKIIILDQKEFEIALIKSMDSGFLRNLNDLIFLKCKVAMQVLQKMFYLGIPLTRIEYSVKHMNTGENQRILQFIEKHFNGVNVVPHKLLPYFIRWSLVNIPFIRKRKEPVILPYA